MSKRMNVLMSAARNRTGEDGQGGLMPQAPEPVAPEQKPPQAGNVLVFHEPPRTKKFDYGIPQETAQQAPQQNLHPVDDRFKTFATELFLGPNQQASGVVNSNGSQDGQGGEDGQGGWMDSVSNWLKTPVNTNNPTVGTLTTNALKGAGNAIVGGVGSAINFLGTPVKAIASDIKRELPYSGLAAQVSANTALNAGKSVGSYVAKANQNFGSPTSLIGINSPVNPVLSQAASDIWNTPITSTAKKPAASPATAASMPRIQDQIQQALSNDVEEAKAALRQSNGSNWGDIFNYIKGKYPNKTNAEIDSLLQRDNYFVPGTNQLKNQSSTSGMTMEQANDASNWKNGVFVGNGSRAGTTQGSANMSATGVGDLTGAGAAGAPTGTGSPTALSSDGTSNIYSQNVIAQYSGKPQAMFNALFSDRQKLADFIGTSVDNIPENLSPLLSQMISDNTEHLKKETGLDDQRKAIFNRVYNGVNIKSDLENYIKGKDEYIDTINKQKSSALEWAKGQDMSNPQIAATVNNYFSYLDSLKSNQETRYLDLVDKSVAQYDATNQQLNALYQQTADDFQNKLTTETNTTTEWYNSMKSMIGEMFDYVSGADKRAMDSLDMKVKILEQTKKMADMALGGGSGGSDLVKNFSDYSKFIPSENKSNEIGASTALPNEIDTQGNIKSSIYIPAYDLTAAFNNISQQQGGASGEYLNPASLEQAYSDYMAKSLNGVIDVNETSPEKGNNLEKTMNIYTNNIVNLFNSSTANKNTAYQGYAQDLAKNLLNTTKQGIQSSLVNDPLAKQNVIEALKSLVSPHKEWFGATKPLSAQEVKNKLPEWEKTYKSKINPSILKAISAYVNANLADNDPNPVNLFSVAAGVRDIHVPVSALDQLTPGQLADIVTAGYSRTLLNVLPSGMY